MNLVDIAIFKHYIKNRSILRPFLKNYKISKKVVGNPDNVEDYLSNVEPLVVITKAVRTFQPNSPFGFDFWQGIIEDWRVYYKNAILNNGSVKNKKGLDELDGYYKVLRENWDAEVPGAWEELDVALKRYGLLEESKEEEAVEETELPEDPFNDLEFVDLDTINVITTRLRNNEASVNIRNKGYRLLLAQNISLIIREKELIYCRLAKTKSGELIIQFNKNADSPNFIRLANSCLDDKRNVSVNSKLIAMYVRKFFNSNEDYFIVKLEELSKTENFINYKITKK